MQILITPADWACWAIALAGPVFMLMFITFIDGDGDDVAVKIEFPVIQYLAIQSISLLINYNY